MSDPGAESSVEDYQSPEWDETPVTLNMIDFLVDAHPDFRVTGHRSRAGFEYRLITIPNENGQYEDGAPRSFISWVSTLSQTLSTEKADGWPEYPCPECGEYVWYAGFDDATEVDGQGEYRSVAHCGVCEFVAVSRREGPHREGNDE